MFIWVKEYRFSILNMYYRQGEKLCVKISGEVCFSGENIPMMKSL